MNVFSYLDSLFPTGADRVCGEVVSVSIDLRYGPLSGGTISWKRKAWYVNASVNAFHMHRGLIREFRNSPVFSRLSFAEQRACKRLITQSVHNSYLGNHANDSQYFGYVLFCVDPSSFSPSPHMWWLGVDGTVFAEMREVMVIPSK